MDFTGIVSAATDLVTGLLGKPQKVQFLAKKDANAEALVIEFDCSIKEVHSRESTPTEYPVEDGTVISDNIIIKPFSLELTGMITDTPIGGDTNLLEEAATTAISALVPPVAMVLGGAALSLLSAKKGTSSPSVAAYVDLLKLQSEAKPFNVVTSLHRYESMWIKHISVPRESGTGQCLIFTVTLVQLVLVKPKEVDIKIFANGALSSGLNALGQTQGKSEFELGYQYQKPLLVGGKSR